MKIFTFCILAQIALCKYTESEKIVYLEIDKFGFELSVFDTASVHYSSSLNAQLEKDSIKPKFFIYTSFHNNKRIQSTGRVYQTDSFYFSKVFHINPETLDEEAEDTKCYVSKKVGLWQEFDTSGVLLKSIDYGK